MIVTGPPMVVYGPSIDQPSPLTHNRISNTYWQEGKLKQPADKPRPTGTTGALDGITVLDAPRCWPVRWPGPAGGRSGRRRCFKIEGTRGGRVHRTHGF